MSSVASSLGTCNPRKLTTLGILALKDSNAPETSRIKILSQAQKSSPSSEQVLQLNNEQPSLLRRREAIGFGFCFGLVDVLLPAQPSEAAEVAPCEFTVAPSGLAFCDKVVGYGAEAVKGQMIKAHYTGKLENGKVFDSSYNRGKPLTFRIGAGEGGNAP